MTTALRSNFGVLEERGIAGTSRPRLPLGHSPAKRGNAGNGVWAILGLWLVFALVAGPARAQTKPVVEIYGCPAGQADAIAEQLRGEFGIIPGVRIAADQRTSQVIAQAPPDIQSRIRRRMAATAAPAPTTAPRQPGRTQASPAASQSRKIGLRYTKPEPLVSALSNIFGDRLGELPAQQLQARRYRLALAGGGHVELTIDLATAEVTAEGPGPAVDTCARLIRVLDSPRETDGREVRLLPLHTAPSASIRHVAEVIRDTTGSPPPSLPLAATLFPPRDGANPPPPLPGSNPPPPPPAGNPPPPLPGSNPPAAAGPSAVPPRAAAPGVPAVPPTSAESRRRLGLMGPVQIEMLDGLDVIVLRGNAQDVGQVTDIINQIERLSTETEPAIEVVALQQVDCQTLGAMLQTLYDQVYLARQGSVSITPLVKPNALLVVGRPENVRTVKELAGRLDQPVAPDTQFQVFHLRYASVTTAQATLQQLFTDRGGLGPVVRITADVRSNSLIVQASPRDVAEAAEMIRRLDISISAAVNEVRIIQLEHSLAQDVAAILQSAIGGGGQGVQQGLPGQPGAAAGGLQSDQRSAMLRLLTIDAKGRRLIDSGILSDVRVTADARSNALIVAAPAENLELLETLIRQIDQLPAAEAQIKVFTVVNGDATNLSGMLQALFATQAAPGAQQGAALPQSSASGAGTSLVPLRFAIDTRTNSIIACGSVADLTVVEAVLTRLDDGIRNRKSIVFRLRNSPAAQVADTVNKFLADERTIEQTPGMTSVFEQVQREVVVEPEPVSNSLVLSATPRFFDEVKAIIEQLDARPPMVMIQLLIAQITLGDTNEFGIELGLQDSVLFDRSTLSNLQTTTTTTTSGASTQTIASADANPGFNFNNGNPLGNSSGAAANAAAVAGQALSNFAVGRQDSTLGYGGLVLSLASENVSMLLRALAENHRVEVLQRPQIMTLDNQPAFVQVGQRVPTISAVNTQTTGQTTNSITQQNVGLILGVTPRISPDGLVVMQIDAENSALESDATGIPIFASSSGTIIRSPIVDTTTAQTTVSAMNGQTVVLGGLIAKSTNESHRKVPLLGDIPLLGNFFRFDSKTNTRTELLIIMTPHIVKNEADADTIRRAEASRMSWCLRDVTTTYGDLGLRGRTDQWSDAETRVIYPDMNRQPEASPGQAGVPEQVPTPAGGPAGPSAAAPGPALPPSDGQYPQAMPAPLQEPAAPGEPGAGIRRPPPRQPLPAGSYPAGRDGVQPAVYQQPAPEQQPLPEPARR